MNTEVARRPALPGGRMLSDGRVVYWWAEILAIVVFYLVYSAIRNIHGGGVDNPPAFAIEHARQIISLERAVGIYHEATIQDWAEHFTPLIVAANYFYGSFHFVVTIFAGVFLYRKWTDDYPRYRNMLAITTAVALVGFTLYPLTPPRLLATFGMDGGYTDTLAQYPTFWSFSSGGMQNVSNQFAAMPSVHIAWATWCALVLAPRLKSPVARWLAILYPVLTLIVIVITGNHYVIDAAGGLAILAVGWFASGAIESWRRSRRIGEPSPSLPDS